MIIKKKNLDAKWFKYEGKVEFRIRPFKFSEATLEKIAIGLRDQFVFCVVDWRGIDDEDGKTPFKCTDSNKKYMYDYYKSVREFVQGKLEDIQDKWDKELKN